jgi:hypothetical protein
VTWHNTKLKNVFRSTRHFGCRKNLHSIMGSPSPAVFHNSYLLISNKSLPGQRRVDSLLYFFSDCTELSTSPCPIAPRISPLASSCRHFVYFSCFVDSSALCTIHGSHKANSEQTTQLTFCFLTTL